MAELDNKKLISKQSALALIVIGVYLLIDASRRILINGFNVFNGLELFAGAAVLAIGVAAYSVARGSEPPPRTHAGTTVIPPKDSRMPSETLFCVVCKDSPQHAGPFNYQSLDVFLVTTNTNVTGNIPLQITNNMNVEFHTDVNDQVTLCVFS